MTRETKGKLELPKAMTGGGWPLIHLDVDGLDLRDPTPEIAAKVNNSIRDAMKALHEEPVGSQCLLKVHIGEPKTTTRMKPDYLRGAVEFLESRGAKGIVTGDTTVAYSGPRGYRSNTHRDSSTYIDLSEKNGFSLKGPAGIPFVVLDRPRTSIIEVFTFNNEEWLLEIEGINRFRDFFVSGGFDAADFTVNNAHLTMHGLAGVAGCVKSIAMGCASLRGKLRMHQCLLPHFDEDLCEGCEACIDNCPEKGLSFPEGADVPEVDRDLCIGCGECLAVCPTGAVNLEGEKIDDWSRGEKTLTPRMADYMLGMMHGKWERVIHVLHMYTVTELCDCVDKTQAPMIDRDLGFMIGRNPFAVDLAAGRLLEAALKKEGKKVSGALLGSAERTAEYVESSYGIISETAIERIVL